MDQIKVQVLDAYADCNDSKDKTGKKRCLHFISEPISMNKTIEYLKEAIPHGYNQFHYSLLEMFPKEWEVMIAREGSVCMYIKVNQVNFYSIFEELDLDLLLHDEVSFYEEKDITELCMYMLKINKTKKISTDRYSSTSNDIFSDEQEIQNENIIKKIMEDKTPITRIWWD
jgi:hypothetical protein